MPVTFTDTSGERITVPSIDAFMAALGRADEGEVFKLDWSEIEEAEARERRFSLDGPWPLSTQEEEADLDTLHEYERERAGGSWAGYER
jgi:hypothetical protein